MLKIVIHISDLERWPMALNNVHNTMQALSSQASFEIAIIANASAVKGYLDPAIRERITTIQNNHVRFFACNNSLIGQDISPELLNPIDIQSSIEIVPVAIIALAEHQTMGFSYIKP